MNAPKLKFQVPDAGGRRETRRRRDSGIRHSPFVIPGFTLVELLTVISIIGVLVAFTIPVLRGIKINQYRNNARAEMNQLETAIERYKAAYGFYPPDNQLSSGTPLVNQLYFELLGTTATNNGSTVSYQSLDDPTIKLTSSDVSTIFGVSGFMNCTRPGSAEDTRPAQDFLPNLRSAQISPSMTNREPDGFKILISAVGGPDTTYNPLGLNGAGGINPWRYNSSNPTNNPGAYDLWIQLSINGRTNLICNWSKSVQLDRTLP